jgi:integrase/recombinase XerC
VTRAQKEALAAYEQILRARNLSPATVKGHRRVLRILLAHIGRRSIQRVTVRDVRRFLGGRPARSCRQELPVLRAFFRVMRPTGPLPTDGVVAQILAPAAPVVLSKSGVTKLLATAFDVAARGRGFPNLRLPLALRDRALLELLYGVGLRCSELAAVRLVDLDLGAGTLLVRRIKRGKPRVLPLPPTSLLHLARYVKEGRTKLINRANDDRGALLLGLRGRPLTPQGIYSIVKHLGSLAGVRVHPHAFRRAVATHLVREGATLPAVQGLLGHVDLQTTAGYVAVQFDDLRAAVEKLERKG